MATMKAAVLHEFGGEVSIDNIPVPEPKSGEVLIRVRAAGVNPVDWKFAAGYMQDWYSVPRILGWEVAGEVVEVGEGVTDLKIGDAVFSRTSMHGFAEYVAVEAKHVALKPHSLTMEEAAGLPVAGATAWQGLFDHGGLERGQKVLVQGAAGGVGHLVVQLAKWKGAYVIGTGSAGSEAFIRSLGADEFINYRTTRFEEVVQDADLVFDTVGGETLVRSYAAAKPGGFVVSITEEADEAAAAARGVRTVAFGAEESREGLEALAEVADAGKLKVHVSGVYPLEQAGHVLQEGQKGHTRGKIMLQMG